MDVNQFLRDQVMVQVEDLEKRIIEFFGSFDNAERHIKDFVLESNIRNTPVGFGGESNEGYLYRIQVEYRLRPKTEDEKRHDRANEILRKNSTQGTCISCNEPIMGDEKIVLTIHGAYHGAPKNCVEGRYNA